MRILYVIGKSQYDSTAVFMKEMALEMKAQGWQVDVLDGRNVDDYIQNKKSIFEQSYDIVFTINGMLLEQDIELGRIIMSKGSPLFCTYLMDHPIIHYERLKNKYPKIFVLSPDWNHVEFVDLYMKNIYAEAFLPHAGCVCKFSVPYEQRKYDVTFMGSYNAPEIVAENFNKYPLEMKVLLEKVAGIMVDNPQMTLENAILQCFRMKNIEVEVEKFAGICSEFREADRYVRSIYRDRVIRTLVNNGVTVHVFGDGWENFQTENREYVITHSALDFCESLEIVGNSKIALNIMPWFKRGSHDRVISAMLCGAVCLTDSSEWLEQNFTEEQHLYYYSLKGLKYLPMKVRKILEDSSKASQVAECGKKEAQTKHTWSQRAHEVMDYCSQLLNDKKEEKNRIDKSIADTASCLIKEINKIIEYFRKQQFLYAMRELSVLLNKVEVLIVQGEQCNNGKCMIYEKLQQLCVLEENADYVALADVLETEWLPLLKKLILKINKNNHHTILAQEKYCVKMTTSGDYTLEIDNGSGKKYLHSKEDPYKEAQLLAQSWFEDNCFDYVVYGLGLGYHVQAMLELDEAIHVTVLEPDDDMIALAKEYGNFHEEKYKGRIQIINQCGSETLRKFFYDQKKRLLIHYPSLQNSKDDKIKDILENYFIEYSSMKTQLVRLKGNFFRNKNRNNHEVTELLPKFEGKVLYIIAAGPSLDKNINYLRYVNNNNIVLATGTVLKRLCKENIIPDYVIITDGGKYTYKQIEDFDRLDVPLLYLPTVYYKIISDYPGDKYAIYQKDFPESESYAKEKGYPLYLTGGSVTTTALDVGIHLKCKKIVFVGLDLAYTGNRNHALGTNDVKENQRGNMLVEDISGEMISTAKNLNIYRKWIENRIREKDAETIEFIDATEGGVKINGTKIMNLKEVVFE